MATFPKFCQLPKGSYPLNAHPIYSIVGAISDIIIGGIGKINKVSFDIISKMNKVVVSKFNKVNKIQRSR